MRLAWLYVLATIGALAVVVGVAWAYPPAGLVVFGAFCLALAFISEVRDK